MGIGGGSGGGGFKLEKTWRSTGTGTTTFNSSGNFTIPFGKYEILVSGRAGSGNPNTPGNISGYNPLVPSTISGYNPTLPSNIAGYNTIVPGNATGVYNAGSGGNLIGYQQVGGNIAGYNAGNPPTSGVNSFAYIYFINSGYTIAGNPTGSYNPPSGGNLAGYNVYTSGDANYNPPTPGQTAYVEVYYVCEPTFTPNQFYTDQHVYNSINGYDLNTLGLTTGCPADQAYYITYNPTPGNIANYNPPSGGNPIYNPLTPGNAIYNPSGSDPGYSFTLYFNEGSSPTCPSPYSTYELNPVYGSYNYESVNYSCTPFTIPGTPSTANYNPVAYEPIYNPFVPGNQNYNSPTGGNPNYNAAVSGNANYNAVGGQNANFFAPSGGTPGVSTNVLGVFFPGGNVGSVAPYVSPTRINRYISDATTYPVDVPTGGYVTIESK